MLASLCARAISADGARPAKYTSKRSRALRAEIALLFAGYHPIGRRRRRRITGRRQLLSKASCRRRYYSSARRKSGYDDDFSRDFHEGGCTSF